LGGYTDKLQTDYFGKGDTSEDYNRWTWQPVTTPQEVFHKYTWIWTKEKLYWVINGIIVRTVNYADAKGGSRYPQTPMRVRIGIWAGGDPSRLKGTIDWAGGETDYSKAPFTMYVKSVEIVNYTPAESYTYSDKSGSSDSIEIHGPVSFTLTSLEARTLLTSSTFSTMAVTPTVSSSEVPSSTGSSPPSESTANLFGAPVPLISASMSEPEITGLASSSTSEASHNPTTSSMPSLCTNTAPRPIFFDVKCSFDGAGMRVLTVLLCGVGAIQMALWLFRLLPM
jgi:hypothetical protein